MIQFNLLPDVKIQYLKAVRTKRLTLAISVIASAVCLAIFLILLGTVYVLQKKNLSDLNNDIASYTSQVKATPNLNQTLTVQNQLKSLPALHDQKPVAARLFGYLKQLTPSATGITDLNMDYTANTASIQGKASTLDIVNTYVDTLKFTKYKTAGINGSSLAFSQVVLSDFTTTTQGTTYTITLNFDPAIFNSASNVTLVVPNIITTRSAIDQPTDLFQNAPKPNTGT